jgi:ketosteroid isomerase-like protein
MLTRDEGGPVVDSAGPSTNREKVATAFDAWMAGTGHITELLAEDVQWTIAGGSLASKTYTSKGQFLNHVLQPFGQRFKTPFRPVAIRGLYEDGDTVIILWDGAGTAHDGMEYRNTYAWFLTFQDGLIVKATALYDSIAFNELWLTVKPDSS